MNIVNWISLGLLFMFGAFAILEAETAYDHAMVWIVGYGVIFLATLEKK